MTVVQPAVAIKEDENSYIQWGPVIAGALAAAALAFVLHSFAAAIGLAVSSSAPTWRDSSLMLQLLSGLYLILAAIVAFGTGGYLAGRMRSPIVGSEDEIEFRDGTHGILVWAIALVLTVLMTLAAAHVADQDPRAIGFQCWRGAVGGGRKPRCLRSRSAFPRRSAPAKH